MMKALWKSTSGYLAQRNGNNDENQEMLSVQEKRLCPKKQNTYMAIFLNILLAYDYIKQTHTMKASRQFLYQ